MSGYAISFARHTVYKFPFFGSLPTFALLVLIIPLGSLLAAAAALALTLLAMVAWIFRVAMRVTAPLMPLEILVGFARLFCGAGLFLAPRFGPKLTENAAGLSLLTRLQGDLRAHLSAMPSVYGRLALNPAMLGYHARAVPPRWISRFCCSTSRSTVTSLTGSRLIFQFPGDLTRNMPYTIARALFEFGLLIIGVWKLNPMARLRLHGPAGLGFAQAVLPRHGPTTVRSTASWPSWPSQSSRSPPPLCINTSSRHIEKLLRL